MKNYMGEFTVQTKKKSINVEAYRESRAVREPNTRTRTQNRRTSSEAGSWVLGSPTLENPTRTRFRTHPEPGGLTSPNQTSDCGWKERLKHADHGN